MTCSALRLNLLVPELRAGLISFRLPLEEIFRSAGVLADEPSPVDGGQSYPLAVEDWKTLIFPLPFSRTIEVELLHNEGMLEVMMPGIPGLIKVLLPAIRPWLVGEPRTVPNGIVLLLRPQQGNKLSLSLGSMGEVALEVPR